MGNLANMAIAFFVPIPSIVFHLTSLHCHSLSTDPPHPWKWLAQHPIFLANILFFINVDLIFWLIGLLQANTWLIDLYWTVIPVLLVHYYKTHPNGEYALWRSRAVVFLTWVWSIRLTHNYFRRERWEWGKREDWRYNDLRKKFPRSWWWLQLFAVYVSQHAFLIGICLPMYAVHTSKKPWNGWDSVATIICMSGIIVAYFADTQLYNFVQKNNLLKDLSMPGIPNLDKGLWRYSRHPNYFGELLWWWGLVVFAWNVGHGWTFIGSLLNTFCLAYVTVLVEQRMVSQEYRAKAFREYQATTSVWIPWFKCTPTSAKDKNT
ncbi:hypothetical protein AMTRI_Chr09g17210 [Amborella trichopoda]